jgi:predicted NBD/HSP70 family sugar kinase
MYSKKLSFCKQIIKQLYFNNTLSCTAISHEIGKSIPYTGELIEDLIDLGYVVETGLAESTGGRRPLMYTLREDMIFSAVVVIDQYVTRIAVMDIRNRYIGDVEKLDLDLSTTENFFAIITERLKAVIENSGIEKKKFVGVGLGTPDIISPSDEKFNSFLTSQRNGSLADHIFKTTDLPVFISNNANLVGLAELRFGAAYSRKNALVINIGWSLGLSLVLNKELYRGSHDYAAAFSHLPSFSNDRLCSCGKTGCLETEASLSVIVEKAMNKLKAGEASVLDYPSLQKEHPLLHFGRIIDAVHKGDHLAIELFSEAGHAIGRGLAILVNLLNPELIVLSGRGSLAGKIWKEPVQSALQEHSISRLLANTELKVSSLGHEAELIGAATLVMENFEKEKRDLLNRKKQIVHH